MAAYGQTESVEEIDTFVLEHLRKIQDLYLQLKPHLLRVAELSTDPHVIRWHRGFKKGYKRSSGTVFSECDCVAGNIRKIFMEDFPEELRGR